MKYKITNCISQEQVELLKKLEGTVLNSIFFDDAGKFALNVVIDSSKEKLAIKNNPIVELDEDEYPKLIIEKCTVETKGYKEINIKKNIKSLSIIRDEVTWSANNNKWSVRNDIGVRMILEDKKEWLFIALDSLAGFIKVVELEQHKSDKNTMFEDYWSMKTDNLESLKREELILR